MGRKLFKCSALHYPYSRSFTQVPRTIIKFGDPRKAGVLVMAETAGNHIVVAIGGV